MTSQRPNWYHQLFCAVKFPTDGSFYREKVVVHLKDGVFFPSSALRHSWELDHILNNVLQKPPSISSPGDDMGFSPTIPPILTVYTDGGPDHNPCHGSVQIALISLFLRLNLDMLIAM